MVGFIENNRRTVFEDNFKYNRNYPKNNAAQNSEKRDAEQNHTNNKTNQLLGASVLNESLGNVMTDTVNTVVEPNQNPHQRLKTAGIIAGTAVVLGGITLGLTKGKVPKALSGLLESISKKASERIDKIKEKPSISTLETCYLKILQGTNRVTQRARGLVFNISPLKDVLFEKLVRNKLGLNRICDAITGGFRKVSFSTVKSGYKKAGKDFDGLTKMFEETNKQIASGRYGSQEPSVIEGLTSRLEESRSVFSTHFGEPALNERHQALIQRFDGLGGRVYDKVYGNFEEFISDVNNWTTFISERMVAGDKAEIMKALAGKKNIITHNIAENHTAVSTMLTELEKIIDPNNQKSKNITKALKKLMQEYKTVSGKNEAQKREKIIKKLNDLLRSAMESTPKEYNAQESEKIVSILKNIEETINTDKKGLIEELLTQYRQILPPEEYAKLKQAADKTVKSINNAVYKEGFDYTDKARDLAVGSALTDVAIGMAVPVISTGIAMTSADTKEKRRSVALKYGLPLLAGIATTTLCTVRLISGGKSLLLGGAVSVLGNAIFEKLDNYLITRDKAKANEK